jgi:hypothetical protein
MRFSLVHLSKISSFLFVQNGRLFGSVVDPDPHFELLDPDPDPGGQKRPTNIEKS